MRMNKNGKIEILKNKIDLEYNYLMQERNALLIALVGIPVSIFNISLSVLKIDPVFSLDIALLFGLVIYSFKLEWDRKLRNKLEEIDKIKSK